MPADLVDGLAGGDQLVARGHVDAVEAGVLDGRRADAQVHLGGAGLVEHVDELAGGVAAHDRVVDHHQALALDDRADGVELHADAELAQVVVGLDEGAVHVAVLHEPFGVRDAALARVADGRRNAGVGHGNDEVGGDRRLEGEVAAHLEAAVGQRAAVHLGVGTGEVDELEDAHGGACPGQLDALAVQLAVVARPDDLAGLDVAHEVGADDVAGARFAGDHRVALEVAQTRAGARRRGRESR